ncbi:hypothetical protein ACN27F_13415 [Solwaraspora sp. WMMB335]|uniref:hypothetical protein n=1 Tax=Solwaraspora sp. WMMB335 TaxID=3404118 RepID=UPI003B95091F
MLDVVLAAAIAVLVGAVVGFSLCRHRHRWCPGCGRTLTCPACPTGGLLPAQVEAAGRRWAPQPARTVTLRRTWVWPGRARRRAGR